MRQQIVQEQKFLCGQRDILSGEFNRVPLRVDADRAVLDRCGDGMSAAISSLFLERLGPYPQALQHLA